MPRQSIDLSATVAADRRAAAEKAQRILDQLVAWVRGDGARQQLHAVEAELWTHLMTLGLALVRLWWARRQKTSVPCVLRRGRSSWGYDGLSYADVRTRFGVQRLRRPVYSLVSGRGPARVAPADRRLGLAAGRMSLGVHLLAAWLYARMSFDAATEVMNQFGGYAPSKRSGLGIVDILGPTACEFLNILDAPEGDGEVLVIVLDDKGIALIDAEEHDKRCQKHPKLGRGVSRRSARKLRKKTWRKERRKRDDTKNARMAKVAVVYTLKRLPDGSFEGPVNRRVFATFGRRASLVARVRREAEARGYGSKKTLFLADGSKTLWKIHKDWFPDAIPCVDWYHVSEYLWNAGRAVYRRSTEELRKWVQDRQKELREGDVEAVLAAVKELRSHVGKSGPTTKGRREKIAAAVRFIGNQRGRLRYAELLEEGLEIGTGVIEGVIKHAIGSRLDGSGMRWTPERAEFVLALRLIQINGVWSDFEDHVRRKHAAKRAWAIPRVTPKAPRKIDPACLEAA